MTIDWLENACEFDVAPLFGVKYYLRIVRVKQLNGVIKWIVKLRDEILAKSGCFIYDEGFFADSDFVIQTRFETKEEAFQCLVNNKHLL